MASQALDDLIGAVADGAPIDWQAAEHRRWSGDERPLFEALRRLSAMSSDGVEREAPQRRRRLPIWVATVKWLAVLRIVVGLIGTILALSRLQVPRLPFVLALLVVFALSALVLDTAGRDTRARLLGFCFWTIAAAFSGGGVSYLARNGSIPALAWIESLRPEAFLAAGLWTFASEFPRTTFLSRLDTAARRAATASLAGGAMLFLAGASGTLALFALQGLSLVLAVPAVLLMWARTPADAGEEATRVRLFLSSVACAIAPIALWTIVEALSPAFVEFTGRPGNVWLGAWAIYLPMLALPLVTAYAVAATSVLPMRALLHAGLRYVVAKHLPLLVSVAGAALVAWRLYRQRAQPLAAALQDPVTRNFLLLTAAGAALVVLRPAVLRLLDRWSAGGAESHGSALARLASTLRETRTPAEVSEVLAQACGRTLHSTATTYLMRFGRLAPVSRGVAPPAGSLIPVVLESAEPIVVGDGMRRSLHDYLAASDQEWITRSGAAALIPVAAGWDGGHLLGMVALGRRGDALDFSNDDREFLKSATAAASLACQSLQPRQTGPETALEDVGLQCARCGLVEAWTAAEGTCSCGGSRRPAVVPKRLSGRFEVKRWLGAGGMGAVYHATDVTLHREVAVKTLAWLSKEAAAQALVEARIMAGLSHPHVAVLYGAETWQGTPILVMEYLAGGTLAARLSSGALQHDAAITLVSQLATALEYLHAGGLFHGDIKPSNIGFSQDGVPKLLDFGLARAAGADNIPASGRHASSSQTGKSLGTQTIGVGSIAGTPAYLSPEVWAGQRPGPELDLWALSVVLCEAVTGRHPYGAARDAASIATRVRRHTDGLAPLVPEGLRRFMNEALGDAGSRPLTVGEFRERLREIGMTAL